MTEFGFLTFHCTWFEQIHVLRVKWNIIFTEASPGIEIIYK